MLSIKGHDYKDFLKATEMGLLEKRNVLHVNVALEREADMRIFRYVDSSGEKLKELECGEVKTTKEVLDNCFAWYTNIESSYANSKW